MAKRDKGDDDDDGESYNDASGADYAKLRKGRITQRFRFRGGGVVSSFIISAIASNTYLKNIVSA